MKRGAGPGPTIRTRMYRTETVVCHEGRRSGDVRTWSVVVKAEGVMWQTEVVVGDDARMSIRCVDGPDDRLLRERVRSRARKTVGWLLACEVANATLRASTSGPPTVTMPDRAFRR